MLRGRGIGGARRMPACFIEYKLKCQSLFKLSAIG